MSKIIPGIFLVHFPLYDEPNHIHIWIHYFTFNLTVKLTLGFLGIFFKPLFIHHLSEGQEMTGRTVQC